MENNGVLTRVGTFPIGIDPERFTLALESEEVQGQTAKLLNRYAGRKVGAERAAGEGRHMRRGWQWQQRGGDATGRSSAAQSHGLAAGLPVVLPAISRT